MPAQQSTLRQCPRVRNDAHGTAQDQPGNADDVVTSTHPSLHKDVGSAERTSRRRLAAAVLALVLAGSSLAGWALTRDASVGSRPTPARVSIERDGLRYEYDAIAGTERLTDLSTPAEARGNLAESRRADAKRLRVLLELELGVDSLERLHAEHVRDLEDVRRLGYY